MSTRWLRSLCLLRLSSLVRLVCLLCPLLLISKPVFAHSEPREPMQLVVSPSALELTVEASMRAVVLAADLQPQGSFFAPEELRRAALEHGRYVLSHLKVRADTRLLPGKLVAATLVEPIDRPLHRAVDLDKHHARYTFRYALSGAPSVLSVEQTVLAGALAAPGKPWRQEYVVTVKYAGEPEVVATGLLTYELGFDFMPRASADAQSSNRPPEVRAWGYFQSGLLHILTGWDHLLFVGALAIAVRRWLDLVKVVAAFTLAHSITLALAVLGWLALPSWLVEPLIAASIVVVSVDNLRRADPRPSRLRLATAFGFGLVHGLGFAGPLVDALSGVRGVPLATAILSFSAGAELGHQLVVLPVFIGVAWLAREHPARGAPLALRYGSLATALGGALFLLRALGAAVSG